MQHMQVSVCSDLLLSICYTIYGFFFMLFFCDGVSGFDIFLFEQFICIDCVYMYLSICIMWKYILCHSSSNKPKQKKYRKVPTPTPNPIPQVQKQLHTHTQTKSEQQQNSMVGRIPSNPEHIIIKQNHYQGEMMDAVPHGTGTMRYVDGNMYSGEWRYGVRDGKGLEKIFQTNIVYDGQWKEGLKHGIGCETETNGAMYQGQFKNGVRHGQGIYYDINDKKYRQKYNYGQLQFKQKIQDIKYSSIKRITQNNIQQSIQITAQQEYSPVSQLNRQRFTQTDLINFEQKNSEIKSLDLKFFLKYYGMKKIISLDFVCVPVEQWTVQCVGLFLDQIDLKQYRSVFQYNQISGQYLIKLNDKQMKQKLNIKLGERKILKSYIQFLTNNNQHKQPTQYTQNCQNKYKNNNMIMQRQKSVQDIRQESNKNQIINRFSQQEIKIDSQQIKVFSSFKKNSNVYQQQSQIQQYKQQIWQQNQKHTHHIIQRHIINRKTIQQRHSSNSQRQLNLEDGQNKGKNRRKTSKQQKEKKKICQLYEFLQDNQCLDFIIKTKDIEIFQEVIGQGGYGKIMKGLFLKYPVAIKDYIKTTKDSQCINQFMKQVRILSDLKHPNIVLFMGLYITSDRYHLVTEHMENGSLYDHLHRKKTNFTKQQQLQIISDIVQGMVYLHNMKKMLHRDLKSSNVLIGEDYKVKLCDFGLSEQKNKCKNRRNKKNMIGTYPWMAPEVLRNQSLEQYSDVYSFGMIIWQILTRKFPYVGMSHTQITGDVGFNQNHKIPAVPSSSDKFIVSLMNECLQRDPAKRPTFINLQKTIQEQKLKRSCSKNVWKKKSKK